MQHKPRIHAALGSSQYTTSSSKIPFFLSFEFKGKRAFVRLSIFDVRLIKGINKYEGRGNGFV